MTNIPTLRSNMLTHRILPLMPDWIRRAALLSSFASQYAGIDPEDHHAATQLNQALTLMHHDGALQLPMMVKSMLWEEGPSNWVETVAGPSGGADASVFLEQARELVERLPTWSYYAGEAEMAMDFGNLFQACFERQHCTIAL
jgi:hypothetical protein